jgi:putative FmdB family regulatory protein
VPLYEYVCEPNGHRFEVRHGMNEPPPPGCIECNGPIRKVIQPVGIMFKGSGFYATDSRASAAAKPSGDKDTTSEKSADAKPADSKPATENKAAAAGGDKPAD